MTQEAEIERCRQLIGNTLGWGDSSSWTNEDFETLAERIFDTTSVRLSVSTLKRVWGKVKYDSSPTMATLNALARYAGFGGWRDFLHHSAAEPATPGPTQPAVQTPPAPRRKATTLIIIFTIAATALLSLLSARLIKTGNTAALLRFDARRTSDQLPNSVVFDYDATPMHPHSVIIQQSWDTRRREKVDPSGKQHTSLYYSPGFFRAKLIVDGEIQKETDVFIPSKGWKGIIRREPIPVYLAPKETKQDSGYMGISAATLREKTGSGIFSDVWVDFANVREFHGIAGDHFSIETTVRNTSTIEQCLCRRIQIVVLGKLNAIMIPLADKGCISNIGLYTGSEAVNGKDHDLSAFGCDFPSWQHLKCTQADHRLEIQLNGRTIFVKDKILQSIGDLVGVRVIMEGTGEIKDMTLRGRGEKLNVLSMQ
jgi:hypothetical protein